MSRWPCWARVRPAGALWLWTAGTQGHCAVWYCRTPWGALWGARRLHLTGRRPCRLCHGTGVLMSPDCDCGAAGVTGIAWGPHEPWCATAPCPRKCPMAASRDEARAVWRDWWPRRERPLMLLTIEDTRVDIPVPEVIGMTEVYRRLAVQGYLTAELAGFGTDGELDDLGPFLALAKSITPLSPAWWRQEAEAQDSSHRVPGDIMEALLRKAEEDPAAAAAAWWKAGQQGEPPIEELVAMCCPEESAEEQEARIERFRAGMRKMDEDPAERQRIERLVAETDQYFDGTEGGAGD